jgi:hypothetical protein
VNDFEAIMRQAAAAARELPDSAAAFDTGGDYRIEIPSVEGPEAFGCVLEAAAQYGVTVHRVSQGSGIGQLLDDEIRGYVALGAEHQVEVCLFVTPRAPWNGHASALVPDGGVYGWRHLSLATLQAAFDEVVRACELGLRSVLVSDEGLIALIGQARRDGRLPADLVVKVSALAGIANPLGARLLSDSGADTLNIASDTAAADLAAFRAATPAVLDLYIEGPDGLGGFMRYHDIGEIVRLTAPVHLKFGLRNAPGIYPSGQHLAGAVLSSARERVRRAAIGLEHLARQRPQAAASPLGEGRRGVPRVP